MAINYSKVNWDTTKFVNPSNNNHMDDGIKAACDKADYLESAKLNLGDFSQSGMIHRDLLIHLFANVLPAGCSQGTFVFQGEWSFSALAYGSKRYGWIKAKLWNSTEIELTVDNGTYLYVDYRNANTTQHISTISSSVCAYNSTESFITCNDYRIHEGDIITNINLWDVVGKGIPTYSSVAAEIVYDGVVVFKAYNCSHIDPNNIFRVQFDVKRPS